MNITLREGKLDVLIASGPRLEIWPSVGVRIISLLCAEMGLSVGQFGGESLTVRGVIPSPSTGGTAFIEDTQKRIHRVHARTLIRVSPEEILPDPFPGWKSPALIPIHTAEKLLREGQLDWDLPIAILGTGNKALKLGSKLLETRGTPEVYCIETQSSLWKSKPIAGWEVEQRRFESLGGRIIFGRPLQISQTHPLLSQLRVQDAHGIRILEVRRVISAGPFSETPHYREHPPGSFLFEFTQTAPSLKREDPEGWAMEEERAKWLAGKIIKSLTPDLGAKREEVDRLIRRAKARLKKYLSHYDHPLLLKYQGKWVSPEESKRMRSFSGVPQTNHLNRPVASIECFEEISCQLCQSVCPTQAIRWDRPSEKPHLILNEDLCTSCGICLVECPSKAISIIHEEENKSVSHLTLPWRGTQPWQTGEYATLVNRRGESLGSARVENIHAASSDQTQLVQLAVPTHLLWDCRGLKRPDKLNSTDPDYIAAENSASAPVDKVELSFNGEKRLMRDRILITTALFETGNNREEDQLFCKDGSCGLCSLSVDGVQKLACQSKIHKGISIRSKSKPTHSSTLNNPSPSSTPTFSSPSGDRLEFCPCLNITQKMILDRISQSKLKTIEAVLSCTPVGEGKCHGQHCMAAFKRFLAQHGFETQHWIDWRFPWSDWKLPHK